MNERKIKANKNIHVKGAAYMFCCIFVPALFAVEAPLPSYLFKHYTGPDFLISS